MISRETIEKVRDTAQIEEVVGEFVNLKKRGSSLMGLCPFHDEKTPSFHVSISKGIFKCFGCGEGGDSLSFVMKHEKYSYPEAIRFLAEKYNIKFNVPKFVYCTDNAEMIGAAAYPLFLQQRFANYDLNAQSYDEIY